MMLESLTLISIGFMVGLSGSLIPGPLLTFTVFDTSKKGRITGHYVIIGHVLWELTIILLILLGFSWLILGNHQIIYLAGGLALTLLGIRMMMDRKGEIGREKSTINSSFGGGIFYSAFNPVIPLWWATAGMALLLKGLEVMGLLGAIIVTIGHWLADFAYYTFVSFVVHGHKRFINPRQKQISILLGIFVTALGVYFITQGLERPFFSG